jgi:oligo-1,6-glucosidase
MRVNEDTARCNVKSQNHNKDSVLSYWRRALKVRQEQKTTLVYGSFQMHDLENEAIISYSRHCDETGEHVLVIINFTDNDQEWVVPVSERTVANSGKVVLSTYDTGINVGEDGAVSLRPFEAVVLFRNRE